jgi:predicted RNA binding protein YcfA (HicA-like mRNA interferase family)
VTWQVEACRSSAAVAWCEPKAGFVLDRIAGGHHVLVHPANPSRTVTVPIHAGRDLKPGTLRAIIRQAGFTLEEFRNLL